MAPAAVWASTRVWPVSGSIRGAAGLSVASVAASVVMFAPGFALASVVFRRLDTAGLVRRTAVAIAGGCLVAWLVWWAWVIDPATGRAIECGVYVVSGVILVSRPWPVLRSLSRMTMLFAVAAAFAVMCVSLLAIHGGLASSPALSQRTVFGTSDFDFPFIWTQRAADHQDLRKLALGWPLADRPPLQAALTIPVYQLSSNKELGYEVASSIAEGLVMASIVLVLWKIGLSGGRLVAACALIGFTDFMWANMVFVWPKLFAASLALTAIALLFEAGTSSTLLDWACVGLLAAESDTAHPAALYGLPALVVVVLMIGLPAQPVRRARGGDRWRARRRTALARVQDEVRHQPVGAPQVAPGRHQAARSAVARPDPPRSVRSSGVPRLAPAPLRQPVDARSDPVCVRHHQQRLEGSAAEAAHHAPRGGQPLWSGGLLLLTAPLLLVRSRITRNTYIVALAGAVTVLIWTVIEYGPPVANTATNNGSYAPIILLSIAFAAAVCLVLSPRLVAGLLVLWVALWLWTVYPLPSNRRCRICFPGPGTISGGRLVVPLAVLCAVAGVTWLLAILAATTMTTLRCLRRVRCFRRR